ncbi:MAG TPA: carbon storage regulator CsrA [Gemmatimonadales bacterium]|jgi:carbon storage regulator
MLVLNRKVGEAIVVDGDIRIVVISSDRRGVRLGIEAPQSTNILREELLKEVEAENQRAGAGAAALDWVERLAPLPAAPPGADPV